jgi:hypothetical protein
MTTSQSTQEKQFLSEILEGKAIPVEKLAYFRARLAHRIHEVVLTEFDQLEDAGEINRAELARRIGRRPEQLTRWLNTAGNWTLDTLSDLLLGMGYEPTFGVSRLVDTADQRLARNANSAAAAKPSNLYLAPSRSRPDAATPPQSSQPTPHVKAAQVYA